jgi:hypothetical protein
VSVPLEIIKMRDPDGETRFKAIVSFQDGIAHTSESQKLIKIQNDYSELATSSQKSLKEIWSNRKRMADSHLQWKLANAIYSFIKRVEKDGYAFANVTEALARDVGMSKSQLGYLIRFRTYYPTIDQVSKEINWSKYREIIDIRSSRTRRICEEKILAGEIKTDQDLRDFKRGFGKTSG